MDITDVDIKKQKRQELEEKIGLCYNAIAAHENHSKRWFASNGKEAATTQEWADTGMAINAMVVKFFTDKIAILEKEKLEL